MRIIKRMILFFILTLSYQVSWSQDNFNKAIVSVQQGNYIAADSLLSKHLKENPDDVNACFNLANIKLQLKDTCYFCATMSKLIYANKDKEALKLFTNFCGKIDSLYYNDKNELTSSDKARYLVESIPSYCDKSHEVLIHDNKQKNASLLIGTDILSSYHTNIIAKYTLYENGSKTYSFILNSSPMFPGGDTNRNLYKEMNPDIQKAKSELNLYHVVVYVQFIVEKSGYIKDFKINTITGKIKDDETKEKLINYVTACYSNLPKHTPAKFRNENVDMLVMDRIVFW